MYALALSGSSAIAFWAAVNAPGTSFRRTSHCESWIQRTPESGSVLIAVHGALPMSLVASAL